MTRRDLLTCLALSFLLALAATVLIRLPVSYRTEQFFLQLDLASRASGSMQVFFDVGRSFNAQDSVVDKVLAGPKRTRYRFALPPATVYGLRLDPIDSQTEITVSRVEIVGANGRVLYRFQPGDFTAANHIATVKWREDVMEMICAENGYDPYFIIKPPPNIARPLVNIEWLKGAVPILLVSFLVIAGLTLVAARLRNPWEATVTLVRLRPFLVLGITSAFCVGVQYLPLFISGPHPSPIGNESVTGWRPSAAEISRGAEVARSAISVLAGADFFSLMRKVTGGATWADHLGVLVSLLGYVLGCALLAWSVTRSLRIAVLISGCAVFTRAWPPENLPSSSPAIAFIPWVLLGWLVVAKTLRLRDLILGCILVLLASSQVVAAEQSLRIALLLGSSSMAGLLLVAFERNPKSQGYSNLGAAAATFGLVCLVVVPALWPSIPIVSTATSPLISVIPASMGAGLFENFLLRGFFDDGYFSSANLVILAGVAWAFACPGELLQRPLFLAIITATLPVIVLASGAIPSALVSKWLGSGSIAALQQAAWYSLTFLSLVVSIFGFAEMRRRCASPHHWIYVVKATMIFFAPLALYLGTVQHDGSYASKAGYLFSIAFGWVVAHLTMICLKEASAYRSSLVLLSGVLMVAWSYHYAPLYLYLKAAFSSH